MFDITKINTEEPINMSMLILAVSFICTLGVLYLLRPGYVQIVNQATGKSDLSCKLMVIYSLIFSCVFSVTSLIYLSRKRELQLNPYNVKVDFPVINTQ
jgi:hypothetical protein